MTKIKITLKVDADQAQYLAALVHLWSLDTLTQAYYDPTPLVALEDFVFALAYDLWAEESGVFAGGVDGGIISSEFLNLSTDRSMSACWNFRHVYTPSPDWAEVKDRMHELLKAKSFAELGIQVPT